MAQLLVRNLDEELVHALHVRAAAHGRSAEAEHREILKEVLLNKPRPDFKVFIEKMPGDDDTDFERDRSSPGAFERDVEL